MWFVCTVPDLREYLSRCSAILGLHINHMSGTVSLIATAAEGGAASHTMDLKALAAALTIVGDSPSESVSFSLDPKDPNNPSGAFFRKVYTPASTLRHSHIGKIMFEAVSTCFCPFSPSALVLGPFQYLNIFGSECCYVYPITYYRIGC